MASSYSAVVSADKLPKLTADNFVTWKTYITAALQERELWSYVESSPLAQLPAPPTSTSTASDEQRPSGARFSTPAQQELYNKDRKARAIIVLSVSEAMLIHTQPESMSAAETWNKICAACQPRGMATKCSLLRQLWHLRMQEGQRAQDVINQVEAICNKLIGIGEQVPSYHKSIALLGALPPSWEQWAQLMEVHSERPQELDFTNVCNLMIGEEQRRLANQAGRQTEVAMSASSRATDKQVVCEHCWDKGWKKRARSHTKERCFDLHPELRPQRQAGPTHYSAEFVTVLDDNTATHLAAAAIVQEGQSTLWHVDSGASAHLCNTAEWFAELHPCPPKVVMVANKNVVRCTQQGTIHLRVSTGARTGCKWEDAILQSVLYVPDLGVNLLSVQAMVKAGLRCDFNTQGCVITNRNKRVVGYAKAQNNLYLLEAKPLQQASKAVTGALSAQLNEVSSPTPSDSPDWYLLHSRLGHVGARRLQQLVRGSMALGLIVPAGNPEEQPTIKECKHCLEGKMHRAPIPKQRTARASDPLFVVHTDICGPLPELAMGTGALYFISFIDDYSSHATVHLLRTKDQALDAFRRYKAWAENYTGYSIKNLHSDGGGEYISSQFTTFLHIMGIHRQLTTPRTPQQNGVAERFNRTIMESARSMLHATGLPGRYWGDAVMTAVYVRNRLPTRALNGVTPYEAWRGEKPDLSHIRVWGCLAYIHVHRVKRNKLAPRARACVFVGYAPEAKGWKLYDPTAERYVIVRDVTFQERVSGTKALVGGGDSAVSSPSASPSSSSPSSSLTADNPSPPPAVPVSVPTELPSSISADVHDGVEFDDESDEESDSDSEVLPESRAAPAHLPVSPSSDLLSGSEALSSQPSPSGSPQLSGEAPRSSQAAPAVGAASVPLVEPPTGSPATKAKKARGQRELDRLRDSTPSNPGYVGASPLQPRRPSPGGERALAASVSDERSTPVHTGSIVMEPRTYAEAMASPEREQWERAMREELTSIVESHTWTLVRLPDGRKALACKWVFKLKFKADGSIDRFKARLVAKGYTQKEGLDYTETFAPVARMPSLRALLVIAAAQDLEIHQMDVRTAFLNGELEEDIYMEQPEGFVAPGSEAQLVYKLHRSLYGLKQAGRAWYKKIDSALSELGLKRTHSDNCVYVLHEASTIVYILLYVDDLLLISNDIGRLKSIKAELSKRFDMKDLGEAQFMLGIQIHRDRPNRRISLSQSEYVRTILSRFNMGESKPASTPIPVGIKLLRDEPSTPSTDARQDDMNEVPYAQAVGALMYAAMGTRPDITFSTTTLSQFLQKRTRQHWVALKRVLRYLKGTQQAHLVYQPTPGSEGQPLAVQGYCDSDWGNDASDRRSITGWVFLLHGSAVSWQSRKQHTTALSSVEAEYMAAAAAAKEAVWWRRFLTELGLPPPGPTILYSDSQGSIALAKNPDHHDRTKHIDMRYHFIREQVAFQAIRTEFIGTERMLADVLTKPLGRDRHEALVGKMGVAV